MVQPELRRTFHDQLASVQGRVLAMTQVVEHGLDRVTEALLAGDLATADAIVADDAPLDFGDEVEDAVGGLGQARAPVLERGVGQLERPAEGARVRVDFVDGRVVIRFGASDAEALAVGHVP